MVIWSCDNVATAAFLQDLPPHVSKSKNAKFHKLFKNVPVEEYPIDCELCVLLRSSCPIDCDLCVFLRSACPIDCELCVCVLLRSSWPIDCDLCVLLRSVYPVDCDCVCC